MLNFVEVFLSPAAQRYLARQAAGSGVVMGLGHAVAGVLYMPVGALQGVMGLALALAVAFLLLLPAAVIGYQALVPDH